jgi:hypothetical protein
MAGGVTLAAESKGLSPPRPRFPPSAHDLALVLITSASAPSDYRWGMFGPAPTYAAGDPLQSINNGVWLITGNTPGNPRDAQFRTFVDPAVAATVPEPASLSLGELASLH